MYITLGSDRPVRSSGIGGFQLDCSRAGLPGDHALDRRNWRLVRRNELVPRLRTDRKLGRLYQQWRASGDSWRFCPRHGPISHPWGQSGEFRFSHGRSRSFSGFGPRHLAGATFTLAIGAVARCPLPTQHILGADMHMSPQWRIRPNRPQTASQSCSRAADVSTRSSIMIMLRITLILLSRRAATNEPEP